MPQLSVWHGEAPDVFAELPRPQAIFVGGGATADLLARAWAALEVGGRLVVHAVTHETELILSDAWRTHGGELTRISVEHLEPIGRYHGWKPARPVVQWSVRKAVTIHFIGAGPGAADLLTVRAVALLNAAPVCVYAGTYVDAEILAHCPRRCPADRQPAPQPRPDHRTPGRGRPGRAWMSPGSARVTRRSTPHWPSRPVGWIGPASAGT